MRAGCVWNAGRPVEGIEAFGTLLGPEITGPCFPWSGALCAGAWGWGVLFLGFPRMPSSGVSLGWGPGAGVMGLLVENCIVDASILKRSNF